MYVGGGIEAERSLLEPYGPVGESNRVYMRCVSFADDELHSFRRWLRWMCVDQSNAWRAVLSWAMFLGLGVAVPLVSHFVIVVDSDEEGRRRHANYDAVVQLSLTSVASVSFFCLSALVRRYGLRRFLFLDKLCSESETVRLGYTAQLNMRFDLWIHIRWKFRLGMDNRLLSMFMLPCFLVECGYKIWWYCVGAGRIPFLGSPYASDAVACVLELCSWLYRTAFFFLVCVLFRLICHLQILRLQDFVLVFREDSDVPAVLTEHFRIRRQLRVISHRFRSFIVSCLVLITLSQLASLLLTTRSSSNVNLFNAGEVALCSVGLVTGLLICLRSATKITHKAQSITSHAARWHICCTIGSFVTETETSTLDSSFRLHQPLYSTVNESDCEEVDDDEDGLDDIKFLRLNGNSTISFQKRQALVTYLENNRAGITLFGFTIDRTWLHMIFGVELSLVLWLLGKTVGFS